MGEVVVCSQHLGVAKLEGDRQAVVRKPRHPAFPVHSVLWCGLQLKRLEEARDNNRQDTVDVSPAVI